MEVELLSTNLGNNVRWDLRFQCQTVVNDSEGHPHAVVASRCVWANCKMI